MERKRKLPARAARVESANKKRTSTPPDQRLQTPIPATPPAPSLPLPVPVEETLPRNIAPGKPLPTVEEAQPDNLPASQYQTVTESGVLVESLQRSRAKWLSEGIFEKYWTKPIKKKGVPEQPPGNPAKESMTKLGSCTITVEPHIFDATMYAIKDTSPKPPPVPPAQPMYRPIIQYGPPGGVMPPPKPPPTLPVQQNTSTPIPHTSNSPHDPQMQGASPAPITNIQHRPTPLQTSTSAPSNNQAPPQTPVGKSTDPVIQLLAERAATDPSLKALMRIVANGEATAEELKKFQSHIDELTQLTRAQKEREVAEAAQSLPTIEPVQPAPNPQIQHVHLPHVPVQAPNPPPPPPAPVSQFQPQPQALRSKGPVPNAKPDISGIAFEFTGGNGDRYAFPKFSILESRAGGEVIASFLIVRKGSSSDSPTYDPDLDYYQPITIRLFAQQGRQLDALHKVVAPAEEVRRYMDEIMDTATRAEYVLLAMRLPKETEQVPTPPKENAAQKGDPMDFQLTPWATTNTSTPVSVHRLKPPKKLLSEEEQYQSFITTVV
ncbi:hypothetical protein QTJ16_006797 [Diplocarpon rosae]|uniref:SWR1-complex protein 3 domain-containing protein n=1 Tax=Diplocarpon rosae TaxID=946125 RepID=A0AAD9STV6_9HELO|nr:hypothetical protein QTJ16_006797 [Diplocarpon rosae]PBP16794.1 hypothetical protein BUE80_DR012473 [Diplocarpon rosae]